MLWLQVDGICNKLRSLLKYLSTPRTSCFSTEGTTQVDDPKNALSHGPAALKYGYIVTRSMHINHLYIHFDAMHKMS
jgi:hypothetical protein